MKVISLGFFILLMLSCNTVQTQQTGDSNLNNTNSLLTNNGEEIGYSRFTKTDKQYLGCWKSTKAEEVINYELKFFKIMKNNIQTSKMSKPIVYNEIRSNNYKDYFVLKVKSKNADIQMFLSVNIVSNDEITLHEFKTEKDIDDGEGENYWNLKREDCKKIHSSFK